MSQLKQNQLANAQTTDADWHNLCTIGGVAALIQLACFLTTLIIVFTVGAEPKTPEEYFTVLGTDRLVGLLRLDFPTLLLVSLFSLALSWPGSVSWVVGCG